MDERNVKDLLVSEINNQIESLRGMDIGSDEYETATNALSKMLDKYNDMEKIENQLYVDGQNLDIKRFDNEFKLDQLRQERNNNIIKNVLTGISVIGGFGLAVWGTLTTLKYDKDGVIVTTEAGRSFIRGLFPKK